MATIDSYLAPGEKVLHRARLSKAFFLSDMLIGALLLPFLVGIFVWLFAFLRYSRSELVLTNRRVIARTGFASRHTVDLGLEHIESIQVGQGLMGQLFQYGTVTVYGAGKSQTPVEGLALPAQIREAFMKHREAGL